MYFSRSYLKTGSGTGVVLTLPQGHKPRYAIHLHFDATNNVVEYKALVIRLWITVEVGVRRLLVSGRLQVSRRPSHEGDGAAQPMDVCILR